MNAFPLIVVLHEDGSTAESLVVVFEPLAQAMRLVAALPQAPEPSGTGFKWGSVDQAEAAVLGAVESVRKRAVVDPGQVVLVGFSGSAALACVVGLRHPDQVTGVVAVGPALGDHIATPLPKSKEAPRVAVVCRKDTPAAVPCQRTAKMLADAGVPVNLQMLNADQARDGRRVLREAIDVAFSAFRWTPIY